MLRALKVPYYRPRAGSLAHRSLLLDPLSSCSIVPAGSPVIDARSGFAAKRSSPSWIVFLLFFFRVVCMPQGSNVTHLRAGFAATGSFLLSFFCCFSTYLSLGFNDTKPSPGFSACPDFAVHRPSTLDPAFDLVFEYVGMCLLFPY